MRVDKILFENESSDAVCLWYLLSQGTVCLLMELSW